MASLQRIKGDSINSSGAFLNLMNHKSGITLNTADILQFTPFRQQFIREKINNLTSIEDKVIYLDEQRALLTSYDFLLDASDDEIKSLASTYARKFSRSFKSIKNYREAYINLFNEFISYGFELSKYKENKPQNYYKSLYKRFTNELFFRRIFRRFQIRTIEKLAHAAGRVSRSTGQLYVSNKALSIRNFHKQRNKELLEGLTSINDQGQEYDLKSLSELSTSNPALRRNELMARLRGLEEYANSYKLASDFYTLTCPSEHHVYSSKRGKTPNDTKYFLNTKFAGHTPRQSQQYLNKQWSKIRSSLQKQNIEIMGVRVSEPHHDGTPHWHMLFFFDRKHRKAIRRTIRKYALEHFPDEKGAQQHRFTAIKIAKKTKSGKKTSAVGYIAKYISKNLSFSGIDTPDFKNHGQNVKDTVNRVEAWAGVWGIRQFQQIGGERVTVWRELRRVRDSEDVPQHFIPIHKAADSGEYMAFLVEARKLQKIKIERQFSNLNTNKFGSKHILIDHINEETGEVSTDFYLDRQYHNFYDELKLAPIIGLSSGNDSFITRQYSWKSGKRKQNIFNQLSIPDGRPLLEARAATGRGSLLNLDLCH